jgi:hypothetical protein
VIKIKVKNKKEFENYLIDNSSDISISIIDIIEKNLKTKKRNIPFFEVELEEEQEILDITLDRKNFVDTLNKNIITLEKNEQYEYCSKAINLINQIINQSHEQ